MGGGGIIYLVNNMKRTGRHKRKKQRKLLIIGSLSLLLFLCAGYAAFSTNLKITAKGNVKEKTRVIQAWSATDQTDFHSDFYKQNIVSVTFLDNNNVPSNATESWNVSDDKENGGVMAWVIPSNNDSSKYDLYIGAKAGVIANEDSGYLFSSFINLKRINFEQNFDTRNVIYMPLMFQGCSRLIEIDVSDFDTSNVVNMYEMFNGCTNLISLDLSNFNTSNVIKMDDMFANNNNLKSLDISSFDTSKVTSFWHMFQGCWALEKLDLSSFNTSNVTNMTNMFYGCRSLKELNLCSFNTKKVSDMTLMFGYMTNLQKVTVGSDWSTTNAVVKDMFTNSGVSSVTTGQC